MIRLPAVPALLTLALAAAPLPAQTADYRILGPTCTTGRLDPQAGAVPISIRGLPRVGGFFEILAEGTMGLPNGIRRQVHLLTGTSNTAAFGVPLPFDIATLSPTEPICGLLRTSAEVAVRVPAAADPRALVAVRFDLPNSSALLGLTFYQQVLSTEFSSFGPPFRAIALSALGVGTIGR
jgi:hypothetical protein